MKKNSFKLISTLTIILFSLFFAIPSFISKNNFFPDWWSNNQIKLGLDLQGGSQLLLQVETDIAVKEQLENQAEDLRESILKNNISNTEISIIDKKIKVDFSNNKESLKKVLNEFNQLEYESFDNYYLLNFSEKYIREFKSSLVLQSLEIIRKRVDEVGTNEPIIQIQGKQRVLVQLPGLENPDRIKSLLGKTAKMNFRLVDEKAMPDINEKKYFIGSEVIEDSDFEVKYVINHKKECQHQNQHQFSCI